jgi:shikimate kinase
MKVLFCGFMGSGKSHALEAVGELASDFKKIDLDLWLLDAHNQISERKFSSLGSLIEDSGWEYFRNLESSELLKLISKKENSIIALGGGSLSQKLLQELRKYNCHLVWLATPFELCLQRIQGDKNRPLTKKSPEELKALFLERKKLYEQAHETINPENFDWDYWWKALPKTNL